MKIAVFYHLRFGGAKRVVQEHVKGLRALGHTIDLYSTEKEDDIFDPGLFAHHEYIYPFSLSQSIVPFWGRVQKDVDVFYRLPLLHKKIAQDIDMRGYDIVLAHTDSLTQAPFLLRYLKTNNGYFCLEQRRIAYQYSLRPPSHLGFVNTVYEYVTRSIRKRIDQENARSAKHAFALSFFGREYMIHSFDLYPKISYLGVDEKVFTPMNVKKKRQVLFVAEKEYIYGYDLIQKAMARIPKHKRPRLVFVFGTKNDRRITEKELVKTYNESVVVVSLSRYDTFGLVPLEAMACAVPVIALNVAGYRETMLSGRTGFLVDFDPQEIADKIMYLLDNPKIAHQMGQNGRTWVEKTWTWKKQIKHLEKLLLETV